MSEFCEEKRASVDLNESLLSSDVSESNEASWEEQFGSLRSEQFSREVSDLNSV